MFSETTLTFSNLGPRTNPSPPCYRGWTSSFDASVTSVVECEWPWTWAAKLPCVYFLT